MVEIVSRGLYSVVGPNTFVVTRPRIGDRSNSKIYNLLPAVTFCSLHPVQLAVSVRNHGNNLDYYYYVNFYVIKRVPNSYEIA